MSNKEDLELDALVVTASSFSPERFAQFMQLLPLETRKLVVERLGEAKSSETLTRDESEVKRGPLPATIIVEPRSAEEGTIEDCSLVSRERESKNDINIVKLHARGAVGEVFVAFDEQLSRELALKRIRTDLPSSSRRLERFIREAEITAHLQHPGIVPIYELEVAGDKAHYTMPLVSGATLSKLIGQTHEGLSRRPNREEWMSKFRPLLNSFIAACNAMDYAHSQDVIHRDIKPDNIMIGGQGQTLVLDWGCAKDLKSEVPIDGSQPQIEDPELAKILGVESQKRMTVVGSVMGTIAFMSPEQASGDGAQVGTHSDIFGLGATLFNLLTNEVAYEGSGAHQGSTVEVSLHEVNLGKHRRVEDVGVWVPPQLAAICDRAMAFFPEERYSTAGELGRDVDAFLAGEPVSSFPEPLTYRAMRFARRHRTAFTTLLGTLLVGFLSLALVAWMSNQQATELAWKNSELADMNVKLINSAGLEKRSAAAAKASEQQSRQQLYETEMLLASEASSEPGGIGRMRQLVERWSAPNLDSFRGWEFQHLNDLGNREFWKTDLNATASRIIFTRDNPTARVFDNRGLDLFAIDADGRKILERQILPQGTTTVDFNRDQSLMAIGMKDGSVKVFQVGSDKEPVEVEKFDTAVTDVRWNIGGDYVAASSAAGELVAWQWYERKTKFRGKGVHQQSDKQLLCWSYDGKKLSWTTRSEIVELDIATRKRRVLAKDGWIVNPCWSHEGKLIAYIGPDNTVVVKDPELKKTTRFKGHQLFIETLQWHPSKHYLLSSSADGSVRIWDADTEKEVRQLLGHGGHVYAAAWNSDGSKVVSGGLPEDKLHVWDVSNLGSGLDRELQDHPAFDWHPDGKLLAVAEGSNILVQDDGGSSRLIPSVDSNQGDIYGVAYGPAGNHIACVSQKGRIWTVDAESGKLLQSFDAGSDENLYPEVTSKAIEYSPDGKYLAGVGGGGKVRVWELSTGENIAKDVRSNIQKTLVLRWSPVNDAGQLRLAFTGADNSIFVFDPEQKKIVQRLQQYGWKTGLAWSPNGAMIGVSDRRAINIWDVESREIVGTCEGPSAMIRDVSWSKSQNRIAALTENGLVCLWSDDTFAYCGKFKLHQRLPYSIRWSPNGNRLVSTARHGRLVFQSASPDEESPEPAQTTQATETIPSTE